MSLKTAIIVEDEIIIALELKLLLEELAIEANHIVASAAQAIELVKKEKPDLILMDILLRGTGDGIYAAQEIRKYSDIPIIFVTGNTHLLSSEILNKLQPCDSLSKPVSEWSLKEVTNKFSSNQKI